jgi:hypothetical protein
MKARKERLSSEQSTAVTKVWDGFQWVDRAPVVASLNTDTVISALNSSSSSAIAPPLGSQKDRRVYVGNLPSDITGAFCAKSPPWVLTPMFVDTSRSH